MENNGTMYYAHKTESGQKQQLSEHLIKTAEIATQTAPDFLKSFCYNIGLLHDVGKYQPNFQKRLDGSTIQVEHSGCGAKECINSSFFSRMTSYAAAYCIMGHHGGLPNGGTDDELSGLTARLKREFQDYSAYKNEVGTLFKNESDLIKELQRCLEKEPNINGTVSEKQQIINKKCGVLLAGAIRMAYSCLVDADFLDTESFCLGYSPNRTITTDFDLCLKNVEKRLSEFDSDTDVKKARKRLGIQAVTNLEKSRDNGKSIHILQMPTGSGKTLCSFHLALQTLKAKGKKRIVYVIPYTGIIEQTAEEFRKLCGEGVLEHHSNYDFDKEDTEKIQLFRYSCENYDAPIIVTTNVQFFESFYSNKSSRLRKLHNMADSVIVFDEVHKMPTDFLSPCLDAVALMTKVFGCEAFFLSATMPEFEPLFKRYAELDVQTNELITDKSDFEAFKNCEYRYIGEAENEAIVADATSKPSALIIVNTKKKAREIFNLINENGGSKYHLSTYMTPFDRSLKFKEIKEKLKNRERVYVVSTSLIEAGVDISFDFVYRELTALDSILQSGGRCNREGLQSGSVVTVWRAAENKIESLNKTCKLTLNAFEKYGKAIDSDECIKEYYKNLYTLDKEVPEKYRFSDYTQSHAGTFNIKFKEYAGIFNLINDINNFSVAVARDEKSKELIRRIEQNGDLVSKRALQKYCASIPKNDFEILLKNGNISDFGTGQYVLLNSEHYNEEFGITTENDKIYID